MPKEGVMSLQRYIAFLLLTCCIISIHITCDVYTPKLKQAAQTNADFVHAIDTSCPIAYVALDIEHFAQLPVKHTEYALLDSFVANVLPFIPRKQQYTRLEALTILDLIARHIALYRHKQLSYGSTLFMALRYQIFDCDINTFLYLTIAETCRLPIYAVLLPKHMAIVWKDEGNTIFWETTAAKPTSKKYYEKYYTLTPATTKPNDLLSPLNREALMGVVWFNIGKAYYDGGNYLAALSPLKTAISLHPTWFQPYGLLATTHHQLNHYDLCVYYANKSLKYYKNQSDMYEMQASSYASLGCVNEAVAAYKQALTLLSQKTPNYRQHYTNIQDKITALKLL